MPLDLVETLGELVAIASVNPMGGPVDPEIHFEARMTDHLQGLFQRHGLPWHRETVDPGRDNILASVAGDSAGLVVWQAHQDTVPIDGMTIDPFGGELRDGRLYGRGSCDVKGGMTAMLGALIRLAEEQPVGRPTVVLACTVNEELGFTGANALTEHWRGIRPCSLIPRKPDGCIVAEPTELDVVVAHRGAVRWRCHTRGRAAHSSQPDEGDNAIYKMAGVLDACRDYHQRVTPELSEHPLCGRPTLCVGTIQGGMSVNTVPEQCTIEIDRRVIPGEDPEQVYRQVLEHIAACNPGVEGIEHEPPYRSSAGLADDDNGPLAAALLAAARSVRGQAAAIGVPFGTDAAVISPWDMPTVVFGPGSIRQAHTADESIAVDQLQQAEEILYRFALRCHGR